MTRRAAAWVLALAAAGCNNPPAVEPAAPAAKAPAKVELTPVTVAAFEKAVEENRGKVVLVDCWYLGCGPCRKKFPKVVELHKKYADQGLVVMSLDVVAEDWAERPEVEKFLAEKGATFANFIFKDEDKAIEAFQARHDAELTPSVLLFGPRGGRLPVKSTAPLEEVEAAVKEALASR